MNKEFKKIMSKNETRYILETASVGGTSAGDIGSAISNLETIHRRIQELTKSVTVPTKSPRNPVGMGQTPGRGTQKHVRSDRKKEKDSKKIFELDDNGKKIFIKFRLSELPNEETRIIMFGGIGNKPKDVKRQDSIFAPVSIDYKDIDDSIVKIKSVLTDLDVDENSKIFIDVPSYLNDILEDLKEAIENEIFDDNKNIEFYRKDDTDASLKRDDEEDSLNYLVTHPKNPTFFKPKDKEEKSDDVEKDTSNVSGGMLIIPTTIEGNRFIKQLMSNRKEYLNDARLIGNTLYISKENFEKVKDELRNNFKERDIHKYFPVKKVVRENKERDHEIEMARDELQSIIADAQKIMSKLKKYTEEDGIMAWQQSKITKTADFLNSVNQSLDESNSANLKKKVEEISEDLKKWFKEKWVRFGPDGKIRGACARGSKVEGKPKCLPQSKAHALGKKGRASAASRKRREDPNPERKGSAINVKTKESQQNIVSNTNPNFIKYSQLMAKYDMLSAQMKPDTSGLNIQKNISPDFARQVTALKNQAVQLAGTNLQAWEQARKINPAYSNQELSKQLESKVRVKKQNIKENSGLNQDAGIGIDGKSFKFNVKDLISFAEKYPVKEVDPTQFKSQLDSRDEDPTKSMDRSKKADLQYPIIVIKRKNNSLWIADGTHRAQKAIMNNAPSIKAKIIPIDDMDQFSVNNDKNIDESCWDTHKQVGMKKKGSKMVPNCVPKEGKTMKKEKCPQCGGPIFPESVINEKKDACYYKVKSRYKVWPSAYACVPEETSKALTRDGWKSVDELSMGEEIMTYNMKKDIMEFKPILNLHRYNNVITNVVKSGNTGFMFECTPNHKWVVKLPEQNSDRVSKYDKINGMILLETNQMLDVKNNKHLVVTAPYEDGKYIKKDKIFKYGDNWIKYILEISPEQRQSWLFSAIVYDGDQRKTERITENKKGINDLDWEYSGNHGKQSFGFKQKDIMHRDAFLLAAFLNGGTVTWKKYTNRDIYSCHFVNNKRYKNLWNFKNTKENVKNVWCPETENNTWVMMQETNGNGIITITGNSGALVKCRKQGSKNWGSKKEDMQYENYKQRLNSTLVELNEQEENKIQEKNLKMIKKLVNPENVKAASALSDSQKEAMMNNAAAQPEMQKNPLELIKFALDIGYSPEDVLASVPLGLELSKDLPKR